MQVLVSKKIYLQNKFTNLGCFSHIWNFFLSVLWAPARIPNSTICFLSVLWQHRVLSQRYCHTRRFSTKSELQLSTSENPSAEKHTSATRFSAAIDSVEYSTRFPFLFITLNTPFIIYLFKCINQCKIKLPLIINFFSISY